MVRSCFLFYRSLSRTGTLPCPHSGNANEIGEVREFSERRNGTTLHETKLLYLFSAVLRCIHKLFISDKNLRMSHGTEVRLERRPPTAGRSPLHLRGVPSRCSRAPALLSPAPRAPQIGSFLRACTRQIRCDNLATSKRPPLSARFCSCSSESLRRPLK